MRINWEDLKMEKEKRNQKLNRIEENEVVEMNERTNTDGWHSVYRQLDNKINDIRYSFSARWFRWFVRNGQCITMHLVAPLTRYMHKCVQP